MLNEGGTIRISKKAYTQEQLAENGAVTLKWNQIDFFMDWLLLIALNLPIGLGLQVTKRINGIDGKLEILRSYANRSEILTDEAKACVKLSLDGIAEYKKYRDAIVHSIIFDMDKGIAQRIGSRAQADEILVTMDALSGLYQRLVILAEELPRIDLLLRLANEDDAAKVYPGVADPSKLRRTQDVPIVTSQAQEHQNRRLSLPPLPEFPSESELHEADSQAAVMDWFSRNSQWDVPQRPRTGAWMHGTHISDTPRPLKEEKPKR